MDRGALLWEVQEELMSADRAAPLRVGLVVLMSVVLAFPAQVRLLGRMRELRADQPQEHREHRMLVSQELRQRARRALQMQEPREVQLPDHLMVLLRGHLAVPTRQPLTDQTRYLLEVLM